MEIKAKLNYLRIAPRKVRLVAGLVRNMDVKEAETQLKFMPKRASVPLLKLLNSAIANAKTNFNIENKDVLYIKKLTINEGPPFKRWRAASRGRAVPISKKTSHVNLILDVKKGAKIEKRKKEEVKPEEPEGIKKIEEEEKKPEVKPRRAPKEIKKGRGLKGLTKKIFRRKSF
jgi:large subunit ribosomal protein L22